MSCCKLFVAYFVVYGMLHVVCSMCYVVYCILYVVFCILYIVCCILYVVCAKKTNVIVLTRRRESGDDVSCLFVAS